MEYRPLLHPGVIAIEKGAFRSSSTKVANFTFSYIYIYIYIYIYRPNYLSNYLLNSTPTVLYNMGFVSK